MNGAGRNYGPNKVGADFRRVLKFSHALRQAKSFGSALPSLEELMAFPARAGRVRNGKPDEAFMTLRNNGGSIFQPAPHWRPTPSTPPQNLDAVSEPERGILIRTIPKKSRQARFAPAAECCAGACRPGPAYRSAGHEKGSISSAGEKKNARRQSKDGGQVKRNVNFIIVPRDKEDRTPRQKLRLVEHVREKDRNNEGGFSDFAFNPPNKSG